jgi:hypothetical protein
MFNGLEIINKANVHQMGNIGLGQILAIGYFVKLLLLFDLK